MRTLALILALLLAVPAQANPPYRPWPIEATYFIGFITVTRLLHHRLNPKTDEDRAAEFQQKRQRKLKRDGWRPVPVKQV